MADLPDVEVRETPDTTFPIRKLLHFNRLVVVLSYCIPLPCKLIALVAGSTGPPHALLVTADAGHSAQRPEL